MKFGARKIRYLFFILAIILAMPLPIPELMGGLMWISPYMFLNSVLAVKSVVLLNLLGLVSLILIFLRKRWVCRYVCPLGVVCDWASKTRRNQDTVRLKLNNYLAIISLALAIFGAPVLILLDPFNIFHISFEAFRTDFHFTTFLKVLLLLGIILMNVLLPNIWCRSICPLGGLQLLTFELKNLIQKSTILKKPTSYGRRLFVGGLTGIVTGLALPRTSFFSYGKNIRPPAALPEPAFNLVCARCGNCSSVCPTHIIKPSENTAKIGNLLTPEIDFSYSYCLPECTICGNVCPSGAISKFTKEDKKNLFMASVRINVDECWLQDQRDCDLCRYHCAYDAIVIEKTEDIQIALPLLINNKCVGCAACKIVCPADAIVMKTI